MSSSVIGQPVTRIDGRLKVTGHAPYGVEHAIQNVAYGVGVPSTIGNGRIVRIDSAEAERCREFWPFSITATSNDCIGQRDRSKR
jgi:CO/xanthine dehydrogenase Mo-binding subunit